jgi:hypothetical protein
MEMMNEHQWMVAGVAAVVAVVVYYAVIYKRSEDSKHSDLLEDNKPTMKSVVYAVGVAAAAMLITMATFYIKNMVEAKGSAQENMGGKVETASEEKETPKPASEAAATKEGGDEESSTEFW